MRAIAFGVRGDRCFQVGVFMVIFLERKENFSNINRVIINENQKINRWNMFYSLVFNINNFEFVSEYG